MNELQLFGKKVFARMKMRRGKESLRTRLWWRFMPGTYIHMNWPTGPVNVKNPCGEIFLHMPGPDSADPNDHWRAWLEREVGKQGMAWDWEVGSIGGPQTHGQDTVVIKFRFDKGSVATAFKLIYG